MNHIPVDIAISKEQLSQLPTVSFPGEITVVDTSEQARAAVEELRNCVVLGFDTETKPSFKKGQHNTVALVQISSFNHCYLFRLKKLGFDPELKALLEDESVKKIGLSLRDDFHVLHKVYEFEPRGFVDLQDMVHDFGIQDISLQKIYGIIFKERISKSQRLSNWEASKLTARQQSYASIDAWACLRIYECLVKGSFDPSQSPYHVHPEQ